MTERAITTGRQLGAAIHDARIRAGLTQATLAADAGVSRKWLIGLEQGARVGAELGKVLAVLGALDLAIQLVETSQQHESRSSRTDGTIESPADGADMNTVLRRKKSDQSTADAQNALAVMRQRSATSRATLDAVRQAAQLRPEVREYIQQSVQLPPEILESIRQATQLPPEVLEPFRRATQNLNILSSGSQREQDDAE